jgi:hypothetical protein
MMWHTFGVHKNEGAVTFGGLGVLVVKTTGLAE